MAVVISREELIEEKMLKHSASRLLKVSTREEEEAAISLTEAMPNISTEEGIIINAAAVVVIPEEEMVITIKEEDK